MKPIRALWARSRGYRVALVAAGFWFLLRLLVQVIYASGSMPELTGENGLPMDLPVYLGAAQKFSLGQGLYPQDLSDSTFHYPYSPPFAMLSMILLWFPARWIAIGGTFACVVIYAALYLAWQRIFSKAGQPALVDKLALTLPLWLVFSAFWGGVVYLNIGIFVALVATLLIESILDDRLAWAAVLATFLLLSKVMWAFPLALPFLLGKHRSFFKLIGLTILSYLVMVGVACLVAGPGYIWQQYGEYVLHLQRIGQEFPWLTRFETPFLGYNHSIKQSLVFVLGNQGWVLLLADLVKLVILSPLVWLGTRLVLASWTKRQVPASTLFPLGLAFALYLGAFIWLDIVWEVLLGVAVFPLILIVLQQKWELWLAWGLFLIYALVDAIQFFSYIIGGESVVVMQGAYVLTDPSLHLPLTMFVILLFYSFIMRWLVKLQRDVTLQGTA